LRFPVQVALVLAAAALVAGCGEKTASTTRTTLTTSAAANTAYERSYTDCASNKPLDLAHTYKVKNKREVIAVAVGKYWAKRAGGAPDADAAGKAGCDDGFASVGR
jgi:hypothetical protein